MIPTHILTARLTRVGETALIATSTIGSIAALGTILVPGIWLIHTITAVAVVAAILGVLRILLPWSGVAPTGAAFVSFFLVLAVGGVRPGLSTDQFDAIPTTLMLGLEEIRIGVAPITPGPGIAFLVMVGALALFLIADLSISVDSPLVAGLSLLSLWVPGMVLGHPASWWAAALTIIPWLVVIAWRTTGSFPPMAMVWSAAVVAIALVVTPLTTTLPGWHSGPILFPGSGNQVTISDDLDLENDLADQSSTVAFQYRIRSTDPVDTSDLGPLRSYTMSDFDGHAWHRSTGEIVSVEDGAEFGQMALPGKSATVEVQIEALNDRALPIIGFTRTLDLTEPWSWDQTTDSVLLSKPTTSSVTYEMTTTIPELVPDVLRLSRTDGSPGPEYLTVPNTTHAAEIASLADVITKDAATDADRAFALQTWLRDTNNFTYDTNVAPSQSDDAIWDFITNQRGYCVHFATTMTIMARDLGIPARVAVGFLPGTYQDGWYEVSGEQAHSWPELWFNDVGWVRFEPTPSAQSGPPDWTPAGQDAVALPTPTAVPTSAAPAFTPTPIASTTPSTSPSTKTVDEETRDTSLVWVLSGVVGLIAVLGIALVAARTRKSRVPEEIESAWVLARSRCAKVGLDWPDSLPPRQVPATVTAGLSPNIDQDRVTAAITALAEELSASRYSPRGATASADDIQGWLHELDQAIHLRR